MVFLHFISSGAAHFRRCLLCRGSTPPCTGLHQLWRADDITTRNFYSLPIILSSLRPNLFYTTRCESIESLDEHKESSVVGNKTKDSSDVFRQWGCSESDLTKIFKRLPSLRRANIHILHPKLEILSKVGIKPDDLPRIINRRPRFLKHKINTFLKERLEYLEGLCGSKEILVKTIVHNPSLLTYDFHNTIKPFVAFYESLGLTKRDIVTVLRSRPTAVTRTVLDEEKFNYIHRTGLSKESKMYKYLVSILAVSHIETIREKLMNLEKYGLSQDEVFRLVGHSPPVLTLSTDKVQRNMIFVLGTLKLSASVVLSHPFLLYCNLETSLKPRFQIACKIEDMELVPQIKGPALLRAMRMTDKRFISAFISIHPPDVAKELMTVYKNAKSVKRLADKSRRKDHHKTFVF